MNSIPLLVKNAIDTGTALTGRDLWTLRDRNRTAVKAYKLSFWVAIGILNLVLWVPLPLPRALLVAVGIASVAFAFIVPVVGIRKHQRKLELLEEVSPGPKKRRASGPGQAYIEKVRKEGRAFIKGEAEVLEESRQTEE